MAPLVDREQVTQRAPQLVQVRLGAEGAQRPEGGVYAPQDGADDPLRGVTVRRRFRIARLSLARGRGRRVLFRCCTDIDHG